MIRFGRSLFSITVGRTFPKYSNLVPILSKRWLFIKTQETPNPDSIKYIPGVPVMEKGTREFSNQRSAACSPLAKQLFKIEGVESVFYGPDFITVTKSVDALWGEIHPRIFNSILNHFNSEQPLLTDEQPPSDTAPSEEDDEVVAAIKEVIDTKIRPSIQDDGGDIEFKGFVDGVVMVRLIGSCRSCSSSTVTLKGGVERMLQHYVPEVISIMQVEDEDLEKINLPEN